MAGWGVKGAAVATIVGQIASAALALYYLFHTKAFKLKKSSFKLSASILKRVLPLGISSFLTQLSIVVVMGVMNNTLVKYGAQSRFGAGIVMKVFQIVIAFVVGIAAGSQPIIGYKYGAGHNNRVKEIYKKMIIAEIAIGVIATLCFELIPLQMIGIFGSESDLYNEFAVIAFRTYLSTMILCCIQKATSIFLQALGKPVMSMGLSLLRDFILSVPFFIIMASVMGVEGPPLSAPIADVISIIVVFFMMESVLKGLGETKTQEDSQREKTFRKAKDCRPH